MKLLYKTRGNASPQGKPRVYFTGHPEDVGLYFDEITDDILRNQNCAVYYDAEPEVDCAREELLRELEQMQLFVIPVTSRFLLQRSRALDVEFPFAMERHIPVLPLMQESGLEELFNRTCGDLQMLDKNKQDDTALPYEEKLKKFLASILVGDDLAEKVRAAFDAYVFLSYRKKNRRYAQELMRLIHKNEFCRDIAIWYDEFLTPGENFNSAIAAALEKCSLFALAVTPSIVEENNYVMTTEYPEAVKSGKPILPVELVPTDKEALRTYFQGLPPCTDAHDEAALSGALLETVRKLAIRENDGSPEHNFFIGLAYLNGIDVEVDRDRAVSLIIGAAEDGLPEAMEKLVYMYRGGDGVERNYQEAIRWQEKLVRYRETQFEQSQAEDDGAEWILALWYLGDYWDELAALSDAGSVYQRMYRASKDLTDRFGDASARRFLSLSYDKLGGVSEAEGRLSEAREYYQQALELRRQLSEEPRTVNGRSDLAVSYYHLGCVCQAEDRATAAKEYFLQTAEILRALREETGTIVDRGNLAGCLDRLGGVSEMEGQLSEAKEYYQQALEIREQLCAEAGTVEARTGVSLSYDKLGGVSEAEGRLVQAKDYYLRELEIDRQLSEETQTVAARTKFAHTCQRMGRVCQAEGQLIQAKEHFLRGLESLKQLSESTQTVEVRRHLAYNYNDLGNLFQAEGQLAQAKECYLQLEQICEKLREETHLAEIERALSAAYINLCDLSLKEGTLEQAESYSTRALEINKRLYGETKTAAAKRDLSDSYQRLGVLAQTERRPAQAFDYYVQAGKLRSELCKDAGSVDDMDNLAIICFNIAALCNEDRKKELYAQAYSIWSYLSEAHSDQPQFSDRRQMAQTCLKQLEGNS